MNSIINVIKRSDLLILAGCLLIIQQCTTNNNNNNNNNNTVDITSTVAQFRIAADSVGYCIGTQNASYVKDYNKHVSIESILQGFRDKLTRQSLEFNRDSAQAMIDRFQKEMDSVRVQREEDGERMRPVREREFLDSIKHAPGVITTANGVQYTILREGSGPTPSLTDSVHISYRANTGNAAITFYSSENPPTHVKVSETIKGWKEVLPQMKVGSTYKLFLSPEVAWGDSGDGFAVGPNQMVIYELTLRNILK